MDNQEYLETWNKRGNTRSKILHGAIDAMKKCGYEVTKEKGTFMLILPSEEAYLFARYLSLMIGQSIPISCLFHWIYESFGDQYVGLHNSYIRNRSLKNEDGSKVLITHVQDPKKQREKQYMTGMPRLRCSQLNIPSNPNYIKRALLYKTHFRLLPYPWNGSLKYHITAWTCRYFYFHHNHEKWLDRKNKNS